MSRSSDSKFARHELLNRLKELPCGGWPAQGRYYHASSGSRPHADHVDWGGVSQKKANEWVSTDALSVLRIAGRWRPPAGD